MWILKCIQEDNAAERSGVDSDKSSRDNAAQRSAALCLLISAIETLASGAPSASLSRFGRFAPALRPLRSVASGTRLARFGRGARSLRALRSLPPRSRASARVLHELAALAHSTRACSPGPCRSLAPRPPLPRSAPSARSPRALRSLASRPALGRSAASAWSLSGLRFFPSSLSAPSARFHISTSQRGTVF